VDIDGFSGTERLLVAESLPGNGGPESKAGGKGRDEIVRAGGPDHIFLHVGFVRHKTLFAGGAEGSIVDIADPPHKRRLGFGVAGVIVALEASHGVDGVIGRNVGVDNAVAEMFGGSLL